MYLAYIMAYTYVFDCSGLLHPLYGSSYAFEFFYTPV